MLASPTFSDHLHPLAGTPSPTPKASVTGTGAFPTSKHPETESLPPASTSQGLPEQAGLPQVTQDCLPPQGRLSNPNPTCCHRPCHPAYHVMGLAG